MPTPTRTRWASPRLGALLALLALGVVAPAAAEAGCRHPGLVAGGSSAMLDTLDRLTFGDASAPAPRAPADRPAPCKGPSCSGQEAPPLAPAPATPPDPGSRWALGAIAPPAADAGSEFAPRDGSRPRPIRVPLAIFHPPPAPTPLPTS